MIIRGRPPQEREVQGEQDQAQGRHPEAQDRQEAQQTADEQEDAQEAPAPSSRKACADGPPNRPGGAAGAARPCPGGGAGCARSWRRWSRRSCRRPVPRRSRRWCGDARPVRWRDQRGRRRLVPSRRPAGKPSVRRSPDPAARPWPRPAAAGCGDQVLELLQAGGAGDRRGDARRAISQASATWAGVARCSAATSSSAARMRRPRSSRYLPMPEPRGLWPRSASERYLPVRKPRASEK